MIAPARTPTTTKTPWPRGGPHCSARALPGPASQSIEDNLHHEFCKAVCRPGLFLNPRCRTNRPRTGRHWKSGSQRSHMEFQDAVAIWRKQRTGTFVTSFEPELRISGDISQWTDLYWIAGGWSRAPCASMNFTLVISGCTIHHSLGPHKWCWIKSQLCHLLESFDIVHVLTEAFWVSRISVLTVQ